MIQASARAEAIERAPVTASAHAIAPPMRMVAASLAAGAGVIHLALAPEHFSERTVYGVFFLAASLSQVGLAWALLRRPGLAVYRAGALGSLGLFVAWIITRAVAPPLSETGGPEPVTLLGVLATGAELATLVMLASVQPARVRGPRARWAWAIAAGLSFTFLFLLASSAVSYVPWVAKDLPYFNNSSKGFSLRSPFIIGMPLPHVWMVGAWSTFALTALAGILLGANVVVSAGRSACFAHRRGAAAAVPAVFAVSSCCGSSAALLLGVSTTVALFRVTPWILIATVGMLAFNLTLPRTGSPAGAESHP